MSRPEILILSPMQASITDALEDDFVLHRYYAAQDRKAMLEELGERIRGAITNGGVGVRTEVLEALPNLEMVSSFGVGYDGIDVEHCRARGVRVTNTPDVLNDAMAETTLGLMIAIARQIPQADRYTREGRWAGEGNYPLTSELTGKTVGIAGLGRVGAHLLERVAHGLHLARAVLGRVAGEHDREEPADDETRRTWTGEAARRHAANVRPAPSPLQSTKAAHDWSPTHAWCRMGRRSAREPACPNTPRPTPTRQATTRTRPSSRATWGSSRSA